MDNSAFGPKGQSFLIQSAAVAPAGVQVTPYPRYSGSYSGTYRIHNTGSVAVHLGVGGSASDAQANAVIPTAGNPQNSIAIAPGAVETMRFPANSYFSGISSSGSDVLITAGEGN